MPCPANKGARVPRDLRPSGSRPASSPFHLFLFFVFYKYKGILGPFSAYGVYFKTFRVTLNVLVGLLH
ncbi:hypothetical protein HanRHA438_Chr12g0559151 [Helianthus annuus]|nr:hypothetical protein HanRHA438_Chr12g0559151 [Helianthus annuus]